MVNSSADKKLISIIIPVYNEEKNVSAVYNELKRVTASSPHDFEILFVNDGSSDHSDIALDHIAQTDNSVRCIEFSRNFGKEAATTAGLHASVGDAAIMLDADMQHPPALIGQFVSAWEQGGEVVIGVRNQSKSVSALKRLGSKWFYKILAAIAENEIIPQATDFRLLDRTVIDEFNRLTEHSRITRGLIDWLGFKRRFIHFDAHDRLHGEATYSTLKLLQLAVTSFISLSLVPLRLAGYLGLFSMSAASALGMLEVLDRFVYAERMHFSGPAILATVILFLVSIMLISLGLLSFYIGHIHRDVQNRPLYVVRSRIHHRANLSGRSLYAVRKKAKLNKT